MPTAYRSSTLRSGWLRSSACVFGRVERRSDERRETVRRSGADSTRSAPALLLYGEEHTNLAWADELALDGYEVHRASDPAMLRAACDTRGIALLILGRAADRGAGLDVLRRLRTGEFTPEVNPRLRALWMSPNGELGDVLRGFQAGHPHDDRGAKHSPWMLARIEPLRQMRCDQLDQFATCRRHGLVRWLDCAWLKGGHQTPLSRLQRTTEIRRGLVARTGSAAIIMAIGPRRPASAALAGNLCGWLADDTNRGLRRLAERLQGRPRGVRTARAANERGNFSPFKLARILAAGHGRGDAATLVRVEVHRGLPSSARDPVGCARQRRGIKEGGSIVVPRLRPLRDPSPTRAELARSRSRRRASL